MLITSMLPRPLLLVISDSAGNDSIYFSGSVVNTTVAEVIQVTPSA